MKAYTLLAKLRCLTLAGFENGDYLWIGSDKQWKLSQLEEECILRDYWLSKTL